MLLSLAASDLGVGLLAQPLYIALCAVNLKQDANKNPTYRTTYGVFLIWGYLFSFASFFGVTALITDRFLAIYSYLRYQKYVTHKRVVALVILIWVFSAILSLIVMLIPRNISYPLFGVIVLACIITTSFFSVKIYLNVRSHMNQVHDLQVHQVAQNGELANIVRLRKFGIAAILCSWLVTCQRIAFYSSPHLSLKKSIKSVCSFLIFALRHWYFSIHLLIHWFIVGR